MDPLTKKLILQLLALAGTVLVGLGATGIVKAASASGEVDYCYVERVHPGYVAPHVMLKGHRSWREDREIGVYPTLEDAKAKADLIGCRVTGNAGQ